MTTKNKYYIVKYSENMGIFYLCLKHTITLCLHKKPRRDFIMEEKIKNMGIAKKLKYAFSVVLVATSVIFVVAIAALTSVVIQFRNFYQSAYQSDVVQMEIRKDLQAIGKQVLWSVTTDDTTQTTAKIDMASQYSDSIASNITKLKSCYYNTQIINELDNAMLELRTVRTSLLSYAKNNENDKALEIFNGEYNDITEKVQDILVEIGTDASNKAKNEFALAFAISIGSIVLTVIIFAVALVISGRIRNTLVRVIMEPMGEIEKAAIMLRKGQLDIDIQYQSEDEFGKLANNLRQSCHTLHEIATDAGHLLTQMSKGNFNVNTKIEDQYVGEFTSLIEAMRNMNRKLNETLNNINSASDQVAIGSSQLAESAQTLAEGATEQAGAIEELTATVENINASAATTATQADAASEKAKQAELDAEKSRQDLLDLTNAMQRINDTSRKIQNIIGEIEDIASQTNLLSLNASIEAARAGDAGRGFGVVADQIGKLADDSAKSAVNTRELLERSLVEIENGSEITKKTVDILNNILDSMKEFADSAAQSSETARKQSDMLEQVEKAIEQISEVVQSNSASAQETSATSEELSAQADTLKNLISQFEFR